MPASLPGNLLRFIRVCVPTYQAAEVLVFLATHPDQAFAPDDITTGMRPVIIAGPAVQEYLALFTAFGLTTEDGGRVMLKPRTDELAQHVDALVRAYNEQPVTLITAIYRIADSKIQSFADSFDLRKDPS
jgi:hypothetical protein